jgi:hypothetical protein
MGMNGEKRNAYRVFVGKLRERDGLENLNGRIILKFILKNGMGGHGLDSSG